MNTLLWLAALPLLHYVVLLVVSKQRSTLKQLYGVYAIQYLDWLFVPFNALLALSIAFSWISYLTLASIGLFGTLLLHRGWKQQAHRPETKYFCFNTKGLTPEGYVHFAFMVLQIPLVLTFLVSTPTQLVLYEIALVMLLLYFAGYLFIIRFVRHVHFTSKPEYPFILAGIAIVGARLLYVL